ncbi:hypothetical protein [Paenibacillus polymyxa]|uniref:hypothetical protein n=1 Tax=Paenibacillus polymyxa TaxID=1406 RepID=UPI00287F6AE3|nr:hypothetical protein [Paenibacillus polymyxa]
MMIIYTAEGFYGDGYELVYVTLNDLEAYNLEPERFEDANFLLIKKWKNGSIIDTFEIH